EMDLAHHGLVLLKRLNAQREFGFLCDCTVAIGDVLFKAHKAVLAAFSNYFRMLFIHQESDCVRLKSSDIQADIFSYLLNLMYTGKFTTQPIDPTRLEQGVKFLHAYPLLQETSLLLSSETQYVPLTNSLYGIQIPDQTYCQLESDSVCKEEDCLKNSELIGRECVENSDVDYRSTQPFATESPARNHAATIVHNFTYGTMTKSTSSRKHYTCNYCGIRFNQRCKLKEHLVVHSTMPQEASNPNGSAVKLETQEKEEDNLHADSDVISDTDQQTWMEDTPPPSEIADLDSLEGSEMDREMKRRKYECPICARKFIQRSHWREHMYIHTGKPYKCSTCRKNFCRANQAARHVCLNQAVSDVNPHIMVNKQSLVLCGGEDNSQVEALFQFSERPYKCSMCGEPFSIPSEVPKHQCLTENEAGALENSNQNNDLATTSQNTTTKS
ncbi:hypothetical protein DNTS_016219, partial [Danionella cerebrum]